MTETSSALANTENPAELERLDAIAAVLVRSASWFSQAPANECSPGSDPTRLDRASEFPSASEDPPPVSERRPRTLNKKERRALARKQRALAVKRDIEEKRGRPKNREQRRAARLDKRPAEPEPRSPARRGDRMGIAAHPSLPVVATRDVPASPTGREHARSSFFLVLLPLAVLTLLIARALFGG